MRNVVSFFPGMRNEVFFFLRNEKCSFFLLLGNEKCGRTKHQSFFLSPTNTAAAAGRRGVLWTIAEERSFDISLFFISIYFLDLLYFCWTTSKTQNWSIKGMNRDSSLQLKQPPPLICCVMLIWVGLNCTTPPILSPEVSQERKGWGGGVGERGEEEGGLAGDWASRPGCHLFPTLPGYQTIISTIFGKNPMVFVGVPVPVFARVPLAQLDLGNT